MIGYPRRSKLRRFATGAEAFVGSTAYLRRYATSQSEQYRNMNERPVSSGAKRGVNVHLWVLVNA